MTRALSSLLSLAAIIYTLHDRVHGHTVRTRATDNRSHRRTLVQLDNECDTIVTNESIESMRMLAVAFRDLGNGVDLYPDDHRDVIDRVIDDIDALSKSLSSDSRLV